jgi:hypothetical protein
MGQLLVLLAFAAASPPQTDPGSYIGAGGCSSSICHGATTEQPPDVRILGTEYAKWATQDKHSLAYRVLVEPRGKRMAEILKIADATKEQRCTVCHVVGSPERSRSDGVACEACHGPAVKWLGPHTQPNSHDISVRDLGMIDTRKPDVRVKMCLGCHLGRPGQEVDHELIAAGHPDLAFELITFTAAQPAHHRLRPADARAQAWAVGQAASLGEAMRAVKAHAEKKWPEFSDLECYQCHHDLRADSWRIARGYGSRTAGSLQLNQARFEVLRDLVAAAAPDQRMALETRLTEIRVLVEKKITDSAAIARAAQSLGSIADTLTERFARQDIDAQAVLRMIGANIERIAESGVNAAEQATMTLDALGAVLNRRPEAVAPLYDYLEHPSIYRPADFVERYRRAAQ